MRAGIEGGGCRRVLRPHHKKQTPPECKLRSSFWCIIGGGVSNGAAIGSEPVGVALIHDHVTQVGEDAGELAVHRQDAHVEHVGVGDEQLCSVPHLPSARLRLTRSEN